VDLGITAWQVIVGWNRTATLGDTARFGTVMFGILTMFVQLAVAAVLFGPVCCQCCRARRKIVRTFILLLMTDLRNYEIVLGNWLEACCKSSC